MTTCRVRLERDSPATGSFEWVILDARGSAIERGASLLQPPPTGGACELVIASELVLLETIPAPAAQQRRISAALRFLVEDSAIPEPEQLHVAAGITPAKDVLSVAIVDRQWMKGALALLERSRLVVRSAYPECLLPERLPRTWTVVWNGEQSFVRTGESEGLALDANDEGGPPISLRLALDRARDAASVPERLVLRTVHGITAPAVEQWSATLGVTVELGPEWHWAHAQGRPALDLLQGEFAPRVTERNWSRVLRRPALLAGALVVLMSCGMAMDWAVKAGERKVLLAQMQEIYRRAFGDNAVVVDAPLQMTRALDQLRRQSGEFSADDFVPLFAKVADRLLDPAKHRIESIAYGDGVLTVSVRPNNASQFSTLFGEMRANTSIPGVDVKLEAVESAGTISLRATANPGGKT
jgi:general secretion pathway protein L